MLSFLIGAGDTIAEVKVWVASAALSSTSLVQQSSQPHRLSSVPACQLQLQMYGSALLLPGSIETVAPVAIQLLLILTRADNSTAGEMVAAMTDSSRQQHCRGSGSCDGRAAYLSSPCSRTRVSIKASHMLDTNQLHTPNTASTESQSNPQLQL